METPKYIQATNMLIEYKDWNENESCTIDEVLSYFHRLPIALFTIAYIPQTENDNKVDLLILLMLTKRVNRAIRKLKVYDREPTNVEKTKLCKRIHKAMLTTGRKCITNITDDAVWKGHYQRVPLVIAKPSNPPPLMPFNELMFKIDLHKKIENEIRVKKAITRALKKTQQKEEYWVVEFSKAFTELTGKRRESKFLREATKGHRNS